MGQLDGKVVLVLGGAAVGALILLRRGGSGAPAQGSFGLVPAAYSKFNQPESVFDAGGGDMGSAANVVFNGTITNTGNQNLSLNAVMTAYSNGQVLSTNSFSTNPNLANIAPGETRDVNGVTISVLSSMTPGDITADLVVFNGTEEIGRLTSAVIGRIEEDVVVGVDIGGGFTVGV